MSAGGEELLPCEDRLVGQLLEGNVLDDSVRVGPGDDCAVVRGFDGVDLLLKTDCVVGGRHFELSDDPVRVGRKAMGRVLSDIAAMGGHPRHALVTIGVPEDVPESRLVSLYRGIHDRAREFGVNIVGGETSGTSGALFLSVSMTGEVGEGDAVLRGTGRAGDLLYVTGVLGGSLAAGHHLDFTPRLREGEWLRCHARPTAMMDLSDGLGSDLPRLAAASGVGYEIDLRALPLREGSDATAAVRDGEDYELLFAVAPGAEAELGCAWSAAFPKVRLTCIGRLASETARPLDKGFDHLTR